MNAAVAARPNTTATDQPVLILPEQLTVHSAAQALLALQRELNGQAGSVVVDAQGLRVFDSSAVAVLLALRRGLQATGGSLTLCHVPRRLSDLVALYGVSELLPT